MKIAIQGHLTRGKEVIQILESLGGINSCNYSGNNFGSYYELHGNSIVCMSTKSDNYKYYILEEFEQEFPFKVGNEVIFPVKIGWMSGKITGLTYIEDKLKYEVYTRTSGYHYVEPHKLSLYPMKEERNITLTLDKAKEWYKKGGDLKQVALQAFTEEELTKVELPKTWEEYIQQNFHREGYVLTHLGSIAETEITGLRGGENLCPSKQSAEAYLAMIQLEKLRNCWWGDWRPEWSSNKKYVIRWEGNSLTAFSSIRVHAFLVFPTIEMAEEFLKCFRDLIEKAGDLI